MRVLFQCVEAVSQDGCFYDNVSQEKKDLDVKPECVEEYRSSEISNEYVFTSSISKHVFKIGTSCLLTLTFGDDFNPRLSTNVTQQSKSNLSTMVNLKNIEPVVFNFLRDFSLATSNCNQSVSLFRIRPGLILYGLPGCGKETFLNQISQHANSEFSNEKWFHNLKFITITSNLIKQFKLNSDQISNDSNNNNPILNWLNNQFSNSMDVNSCSKIPAIILWPNIDNFLYSSSSHGSTDDNLSSESASMDENSAQHKSYLFYNMFMESLNHLPGVQFSILATTNSIDKVFNVFEFRELFYKRLLVPLPNACERLNLLKQFICQYCPLTSDQIQFGSENPTDSIESINDLLHLIASQLHGFTPSDLLRLVTISYSAYLSNLLTSETEDENYSLNQNNAALLLRKFCQQIQLESKVYLPINLSKFITQIAPLYWHNIAGYDHLKQIFRTMIQDRLRNATQPDSKDAQADAALGLRVPRGILLHGPPGCSKTMFVRALATECQLPLIAVQSSRIFGRYVGDSERNMRQILVQVRASAPAILFIDEIDLLLPSRSSSETGASEHVLGELLTAMDGVEGQTGQIILIAATNRIDKLDSALSRAGRFDLILEVPPPDEKARLSILKLELSQRSLIRDKTTLLESKWLSEFARDQLVNYTGAEIVQLIEHAAELARNENCVCSESGDHMFPFGLDRSHLVKARQICVPRSVNNCNASISSETLPSMPLCTNSTDWKCLSFFKLTILLVILIAILVKFIHYLCIYYL